MLFGKNRVLKLVVVNKIVRAQRVQFGNQRPISESPFSPNSTTDLSQVNSVHNYIVEWPRAIVQSTVSNPRRLFQNPEGYFKNNWCNS